MHLDSSNRSDSSILTAAAKRIGVESRTVYRYLTGQQYPSLGVVRRIEKEFGWAVEDQIRLLPEPGVEHDLAWGMVLAEVLKENLADTVNDPDFPPARPSEDSLDRRRDRKRRVSRGWTHAFVATALNTRANNITRWLSGQQYPEVRAMLRIEQTWDWPASEQINLVPVNGVDDRYATAFKAVLDARYPVD